MFFECCMKIMNAPWRYCFTHSGSVGIHAKNLQKIVIEIFKPRNLLSPSLLWECNEKKCVEYNLRTKSLCKVRTIRSTSFGLESLSFRGNFLWNTLDDSTQNGPTLLAFKYTIKIVIWRRMHMHDLPLSCYCGITSRCTLEKFQTEP